jgi:hypothetical protein
MREIHEYLSSIPLSYMKMRNTCLLSDRFFAMDRHEQAHHLLLESIEMFESVSDSTEQCWGGMILAQSFYNQRNRERDFNQQAFTLLDQVKEMSQKVEDVESKAEILFSLSYCYSLMRHRSRSGVLLRESHQLMESRKN